MSVLKGINTFPLEASVVRGDFYISTFLSTRNSPLDHTYICTHSTIFGGRGRGEAYLIRRPGKRPWWSLGVDWRGRQLSGNPLFPSSTQGKPEVFSQSRCLSKTEDIGAQRGRERKRKSETINFIHQVDTAVRYSTQEWDSTFRYVIVYVSVPGFLSM